MMETKRAPAKWKVDLVNTIADEIKNSPVIAIVNISGLRNKEFQKIRNDIRKEAKIRVIRTLFIKRALEKSDRENIGKLIDLSQGQVALITTAETPKSIYDVLISKRTKAAARGGEIAENDIVIEPKETTFPPGPMISVFQKVGIPAGIERGKIVIKSEVTLIRKGEVIPKDKAHVLEKLEILPVTVGLNMIAAYSGNLVYSVEALSITVEQIKNDMANAFLRAKGLALNISYLVPEILPEVLSKAYMQAQALAFSTNFVDEKNIDIFIRKAVINDATINSLINKDLNNEKIGNKKESKEEKKEEKSNEDDASSGLGSLFG
jgi:large subunit ribosomal protein L10